MKDTFITKLEIVPKTPPETLRETLPETPPKTTVINLLEPGKWSRFFGRVRSIEERPNIDMIDIATEYCTYRISKEDLGMTKIKEGKKILIIFSRDGQGNYVIVAVFRRAPIVLLRALDILQKDQILSQGHPVLSKDIVEAFRPSYLIKNIILIANG